MVFALVTSGEHSVWQYLPELWVTFVSLAAPKDNVGMRAQLSFLMLQCPWYYWKR